MHYCIYPDYNIYRYGSMNLTTKIRGDTTKFNRESMGNDFGGRYGNIKATASRSAANIFTQ